MKVKDEQVFCEVIEFQPGINEKTIILVTGRRGGVIELVCVAINPRGTDKMKNVNRVMKIKGIECDLDSPVDVGHPAALSWFDTIYLSNGHEFGIRLDGEKVDSTCRVFVHYIWHKNILDTSPLKG
jgi:hypothetical protein